MFIVPASQYLALLQKTPDISFYEIHGEHEGAIKRYVASTAQTRRICNVPEVLGYEYTSLLEQAVTLALKNFPTKNDLLSMPEDSFSVLVLLRGGLNFGIRNALHNAYGFNRHSASFMTSQRYRKDERWHISDDQYRKLEIQNNATLLVGDVVATGTTVENSLNVMTAYLKEKGIKMKNMIFFTIGCHKIEKILEQYDLQWRELNPAYGCTSIVYFEGKFKLVDSKTNLRIQIQGTDLIRSPALLAPEFELSQYENVAFPLERCTIYDAGSRAFNIAEYIKDVREYWSDVEKLAKTGLTLHDAVKERWPETEYKTLADFLAAKKGQWREVDETFIHKIHQAYQQRWTPAFTEQAKTKEALLDLCSKRLAVLTK